MFFWRKKGEAVELPQKKEPLPKHAALDLEGVGKWAEEHQMSIGEAYRQSFAHLFEFIRKSVELNVPIITFYIMSPMMRRTAVEEQLIEQFAQFLEKQDIIQFFVEHKVKVTILGKWYDLHQRIVDAIRKVGEETKDFDSFFVNFCINYDGQEEIVDACKLIARQVKMGRVDPDMIKKDLVKESVYSSYFIPPDVIIRNGQRKVVSSLLLWDSPGARLVFSEKLFPDLTVEEFERMLH